MNTKKQTELSPDHYDLRAYCVKNFRALNKNMDALNDEIIEEEIASVDQLREIIGSSVVDWEPRYSLNDIDFQKVTRKLVDVKINSDSTRDLICERRPGDDLIPSWGTSYGRPGEDLIPSWGTSYGRPGEDLTPSRGTSYGRPGDDLTPSWGSSYGRPGEALTPSWGTSYGRPGDDLTPSWGNSYGRPGEDLETLRRPVTVECRQILTPDGSILVQKRLRVRTSIRRDSESPSFLVAKPDNQCGEVTAVGDVYCASISAIVLNDCLRPKTAKIAPHAVDSPMVLSRSTSLRLRPSNEYSIVGENRELIEQDQVGRIDRNRLRWSTDYNSRTTPRRSIERRYGRQPIETGKEQLTLARQEPSRGDREEQSSGAREEQLREAREEQPSEAGEEQARWAKEEQTKEVMNEMTRSDHGRNRSLSGEYDMQYVPASRRIYSHEVSPAVKNTLLHESEKNKSSTMTARKVTVEIPSNKNVLDPSVIKHHSQFLASCRPLEQTDSIRTRDKEQINLIRSDATSLTNHRRFDDASTQLASKDTRMSGSQPTNIQRLNLEGSTSLSSSYNDNSRLKPSSYSTIGDRGVVSSNLKQAKKTMKRDHRYEVGRVKGISGKGEPELGQVSEMLGSGRYIVGPVKGTKCSSHYELGQVKRPSSSCGHYGLGQLNETPLTITEDLRNSRPMGSVSFYRAYSKQVFKHAPKLTGFDVDTLSGPQGDKKTISYRSVT